MDAERWKQVDELLQSALLLPSGRREDFLRQACAGDAALEQEVRSLLNSHQQVGGFLEVPAINVEAQAIAQAEAHETSDALLGQIICHYRVLRKLGSGGMGAVYEGEDLRLGRHVALKLLLESQAGSSKALLRFEHEARAISSLNHPNICTLYEVEEYDGKPVIVMELLDGETLKQRMKAGRVSLPQLLQWGIDVADALDAAHSTGLVHRDIKPANLFITTRGRAKVLDFGLAKLTAPGTSLEGQEDSLTSLGVVLGTTPYMSPEQVRGDELDGRTDVFSLGVVLYEMATGRRPFAQKNMALTMDAVLHKSPASLTEIDPELSTELEGIITKTLEKDRNLRYQSAAEMRADLQRLKTTSSSPSALRAAPTARKASKTSGAFRQKLWKVVVPAFVALAVALIFGVLYHRSRQTVKLTEKDTVVLADFANSTGEPVFDGTLRQGLSAQLEQSPFLNLLSDERIGHTLSLMTQPKDAHLTHELASEVCQRTASAATVEGSVASLGSQYVLGLKAVNCRTGDLLADEQVTANGKEQVLKALGSAATKLRERLGESLGSVQRYDTPQEDVTTSSLEALNAFTLGLKARHEKGSWAAIPFFQQAIQLDPKFAMAYLRLAHEYWNIGEAVKANPNFEKAFALRDRVSARENFYITSDYYDSLVGDFQKSAEIYQLWSQTYPQDPIPLDRIGNDYLLSGNYPQALEVLLQEKELVHGNYYNYVNLASAYNGLNRFHEARITVEDALSRKLEPAPGYTTLYWIDFLEANASGMQADVAWATGKPGIEEVMFALQSDTEAYSGHRSKAREFSRRAVAAAQRDNETEVAAIYTATAALHEAEFGDSAQAIEAANSALALAPSRDVKTLTALAFARAGLAKRAQALADELAKANPSNTLLTSYSLPTMRAAAELDLNHPAQAVEILQIAVPYELGQLATVAPGSLYPAYVRGQAYLRMGKGSQAAAELQKLLDHPGCVVNFPLGALAHLQLGRAYALEASKTKARVAYQDFLALWKDADPDIPVLKEAKAEYAKLQ